MPSAKVLKETIERLEAENAVLRDNLRLCQERGDELEVQLATVRRDSRLERRDLQDKVATLEADMKEAMGDLSLLRIQMPLTHVKAKVKSDPEKAATLEASALARHKRAHTSSYPKLLTALDYQRELGNEDVETAEEVIWEKISAKLGKRRAAFTTLRAALEAHPMDEDFYDTTWERTLKRKQQDAGKAKGKGKLVEEEAEEQR